jgi:PAS domain S-box-containing protein
MTASRHGEHWLTLLAPPADEAGPDRTRRRLERALGAVGAVAWEWKFGAGKTGLAEDYLAAVHPADRDWLVRAVAAAARGEAPYDFEFRLRSADGATEWVHDLGHLERDAAGQPLRLTGVARLVTARRRAEAALHAAFEHAPVGMAYVSLRGAFARVNDRLCRFLDRPREVLLSLGVQDVTHPADLAADLALVEDLVAGRIESFAMEKRYLRGDGAVAWGRLTVSLARDADGAPDHFVSLVEDVSKHRTERPTEQKWTDSPARRDMPSALAAREAELARVQRIGRIGGFEVDLRDPAFMARRSPEDRALHALAPGVNREPHEVWLARLYPADRARADATLRQALASGGMRYENEYRIVRTDGEIRWIAATAEIERDPAGRPLRLVGAHQDITERKRAELAQAESEAFATGILAATSDSIVVLDAEDRVAYMNEPGRCQKEIDDLAQVIGRPVLSLWPAEAMPEIRAALTEARATGTSRYTAFGPTAKGTPKWWEVTVTRLPSSDGGETRLLFVARDITERKRADAALAEAEREARRRLDELEAVYATAPVGLAVLTPDLRYLRINERLAEINGVPAAAHIGRTIREILPNLADQAEALARRILESGEPAPTVEFTGETPAQPGVRRTWIGGWTPVRGPDGAIAAINLVSEEVTERRATEAREHRMMQIAERSNDMVAMAGLNLALTYMNAGGRRTIGLDETADVRDLRGTDYVAPESLALFREVVIPTAREKGLWEGEMRLVNRRTGAPIDVYRSFFALRDPDGTHSGYGSVTRDITEEKRAAAALAESEAFARTVLESSPDCLKILGLDGTLEYLNHNGVCLLELNDCGAVVGEKWETLWPDGQRPAIREAVAAAREGSSVRFASVAPTPKGTPKVWDVAITPIPGPDGRPAKLIASSRDITEQEASRAALTESEARLRQALAAGCAFAFTWNRATDEVRRSDTCEAILGLGGQPDPTRDTGHAYFARVHPEDRNRFVATVAGLQPERPGYTCVYRYARPDGEVVWLEASGTAEFDSAGRTVRITGLTVDVTARKAVEERLRESEANLRRLNEELEARVQEEVATREAAQARLAHSERMQALGQLAGGIAHDFNNVMQAVGGGAALIERRANDAERVRGLARLMTEAVARGAAITRRLLHFSRRADLRAKPVDAAALLAGLREILAVTLGAGLDVRIEASDGLPPLLADKGQLETALINLATNGRDAMAGQGTLTLTAAADAVPPGGGTGRSAGSSPDLEPGSYVRLSVSDTGTGMDAATLARAMEPFFTTKPLDQGTGLGLAMVGGFARQSGGDLRIESAPGRGTTVTLWLPTAEDETAPAAAAAGQVAGPGGQHARLMLVDDDALVRDIMAREMEEAGYAVLALGSGDEALARLDAGEAVDLIVSDLSMPGMDGVALVREAKRRRPGLPAILLTGFVTRLAEIAVGEAVGGLLTLLRKPVEGKLLAERVAVLLEGRSRPETDR